MATKTALETLEAGRDWLADESHWTRNQYFSNSIGVELFSTFDRKEVARTCATGALCVASGETVRDVEGRSPAWISLKEAMGIEPTTFNDTHTHAEVLAAFDAAIAKEKAKVTA